MPGAAGQPCLLPVQRGFALAIIVNDGGHSDGGQRRGPPTLRGGGMWCCSCVGAVLLQAEGAEALLVWALKPGAVSAEEQPVPAEGVRLCPSLLGSVSRRCRPRLGPPGLGRALGLSGAGWVRLLVLALRSPRHLLPAPDGWTACSARATPFPPAGILAPQGRLLDAALAVARALCALTRSPRQAPEPPREGRTCQGQEPARRP